MAVRRQVNRLPAQQRITDIMLAARAVFTERGYADAPMSEIAERAGVVEGSIYRFFTNKRELLVRVIEHWYEEMLARDDLHFAATKGTWNQMRFIVHQHLTWIKSEPGLSRLVFQELRPDSNYRATRVFHLNQAYTQRIVDIVKRAVAEGEFRPDASPTLVRDMIYGCIEHRTWAFLRDEGDFDSNETADGIADIVYRGLVNEQPPDHTVADALARLEDVTERLEAVSRSQKG